MIIIIRFVENSVLGIIFTDINQFRGWADGVHGSTGIKMEKFQEYDLYYKPNSASF